MSGRFLQNGIELSFFGVELVFDAAIFSCLLVQNVRFACHLIIGTQLRRECRENNCYHKLAVILVSHGCFLNRSAQNIVDKSHFCARNMIDVTVTW